MKNFLMLGFLAFFILFCVQCKEALDEVPEASTLEKPYIQIITPFDLVGTWEWKLTGAGCFGECTSPATEGYEAHLLLFPNRTYKRFLDYELIQEGTYFYNLDTSFYYENSYLIHFDDGEGRLAVLDNNILVMSSMGTNLNGGLSYKRLTE